MESIEVLDEDANRLDVLWSKMVNYAGSFALEYRRQQEAFDPDRYTPPRFGHWTFRRWLMTKTGISEKTCLLIIETLERGASSADRERNQHRRREIAQEEKAERERIRAEQEPERQAKAAARALRLEKNAVSAIQAPPLVERIDATEMDELVDHVFYQLVAGKRPGKEQTKAETGAPDRRVFNAHAAAKERLRMHVLYKIPIPPKPLRKPAEAAATPIQERLNGS